MELQSNSEPAKRVIGRPFEKGKVANPTGRPKDELNIAKLARSYSREAIAALVKCLNDPKHAVAAAVAILDRGYGKPQQTVENNTTITIRADQLSDDELARLVGVGASRQVKTIEHERGNANTAPQTLPSRDAVDVLPNDIKGLG